MYHYIFINFFSLWTNYFKTKYTSKYNHVTYTDWPETEVQKVGSTATVYHRARQTNLTQNSHTHTHGSPPEVPRNPHNGHAFQTGIPGAFQGMGIQRSMGHANTPCIHGVYIYTYIIYMFIFYVFASVECYTILKNCVSISRQTNIYYNYVYNFSIFSERYYRIFLMEIYGILK